MGPREDLQRLVAGMAAMLLAVTAMFVTPPAASAAVAAPTGLSPANVAVNDVPTLQWGRVRGAAQYDLEVSATANFNERLYTVRTSNRRGVPTADLPNGRVYWRVRSVDVAGGAGAWQNASFTVNENAGPTLQSPADGVELPQPSEPPLLSWTPVQGAVSYEVQIDQAPSATVDADFVNATTATTKTTSYLVEAPLPTTPYSWRVRAQRNSGAVTAWSQVRNYEIAGLDPVTVTTPSNNQAVDDVVFSWEPVPGAKDYEIRVSTDQDFNTVTDQLFVKSTRYSPPTTYENDSYWWQVRARDNQNNTMPWSESVPAGTTQPQFQRHWPSQVQLEFPAVHTGQVTSDPFYFEWSPVDHASRYQLDMGTDANFSPNTFETCFTRATTYTPGVSGPWQQVTGCMPDPGVTYYWRVRGVDDPKNVNGIWSEPRSFVYEPGRVSLLSPAAAETVAIPTLRWSAAQDAEKYRVIVRNKTGAEVARTDTYSLSWTPPAKLTPADGPFRWSVQSIDSNGDVSLPPVLGAQRTFDVSGTIPTNGVPALTPLSPTTEAPLARFPTLTWEPDSRAVFYRVMVAKAGSTTFFPLGGGTNFAYPAATDTSATWLQAGSYHWFVEAYGDGGVFLGMGTEGNFSVTDLAPVQGQRLALSAADLKDHACTNRLDAPTGPTLCRDLKQTPVLDWQPVPEASHYLVYLFKDRALTTPVYGAPGYVTTQNTRWTPTELLPDSTAQDAYYWYVRPCKSATICAPDPRSATHAFDKRSNAVELLTPTHNQAGGVADQLTMTWKSQLDVNQVQDPAHTDATGAQATVEAKSYRVEIAADDTFANVLHTATVDQTTYTPFLNTLPEGPLWWRVQAIDGSGNALTASAARQIVKQSPPPALSAPADGAVVDNTPFLRWRPVNAASAYEVEIYRNNDKLFSPANRVWLSPSTSKHAAYTPSNPLPASAQPYVWRVRRLDADGRPGAWSTARTFRIGGSAPQMLSPGSGASVDPKESFFTWEATPGATSYLFERRSSGATWVAETSTTYALAYASTGVLTDGAWEWRVTSRDAVGQPLDSSPWRSFTVDSVQPTVTRVSPSATTTRRNSNWVVLFSEPVTRVNTTTMRLYRSGRRDSLAAKVTSSNGGRTWTLNPSSLMSRGVKYTLKLSGITDRAKNPLAATGYSRTPR